MAAQAAVGSRDRGSATAGADPRLLCSQRRRVRLAARVSAICARPARPAASIAWRASCAGHKIKAIRGYKAPRHDRGPAVDHRARTRLKREFTVDAPDRVWVTDITYIRTWQGWLYLAVVMDLYARKIVGWSMKPTLARELVLDALLMAVWRRKPRAARARALGSRHPVRQR